VKITAYVFGVSGGVRIYNLERYTSASHLHPEEHKKILKLTNER